MFNCWSQTSLSKFSVVVSHDSQLMCRRFSTTELWNSYSLENRCSGAVIICQFYLYIHPSIHWLIGQQQRHRSFSSTVSSLLVAAKTAASH